jgi:uncharacterized protein YdhG (YjbR/CyaY superfamily)
MPAPAKTFEDALAAFGAEQRAVLEKLRRVIHAAVPDAEECVSYGLPAFKWNGKPIAGLGAGETHCAYYPMSGSVVGTCAKELARYETSKGAIRFPTDKPLPAALVKKLLKARMAEIEAAAGGKTKNPR